MKTIRLTNTHRQATVDDVDFEWLSQWEWFETPEGYAARTHPFFQGQLIYMHNEVWNRAHPNQTV